MDHPLPAPHVRNWRTATYVAGAIAAVELVLLLVLAFALVGKSLLPRAEAAAAETVAAKKRAAVAAPAKKAKAKPERAVAQLPRGKVRVLVLNGNGQTGAAASAAQLLQARGYRVADTGNAARLDYARSVVMYRSGFRGEAIRFAKDLNVKIVSPLDGLKRSQLKSAQLALVVGMN